MAWKFPKRNTRRDSPIDIETVNENVQEFTGEAGNLNEHNWSATSPVCQKQIQIPANTGEDSAVKIHSKSWYSEHQIGAEMGPVHLANYTTRWENNPKANNALGDNYIPPYGPRNIVFNELDILSPYDESDQVVSSSLDFGIIEDDYSSYDSYCSSQKNYCPIIDKKPSWQVIQQIDGMAQACLMWIVASFSLFQESTNISSFRNRGGQGEDGGLYTFYNWARNSQWDGLYNGPNIGGFQFGLRLNGEILWETVTGSGEPDNDAFSAMGLLGPCPITLDAIVPVSAGKFTLEIVARILRQENSCEGYVPTGELTAIEFRR
tara:strand:+ start:1761 stop:2720 length:960 start_codon:yes stop_codon:yes gene_type:complete